MQRFRAVKKLSLVYLRPRGAGSSERGVEKQKRPDHERPCMLYK